MKLPKFEMNEKNRTKLIKSCCYLVGIILVFAILSRYITKGGKTLSQYAAENPDTAYGNLGTTQTQSTMESQISPSDDQSQNQLSTLDDNNTSVSVSIDRNEFLGLNGDSMIKERVVYEPDFYYEPLSNELQTYITGNSYPATGSTEISYDDLCYVHVLHYDFSGEPREGELISNRSIAQDLVEIFYELYVAEYQIEKISLIDTYDGDDTLSMEDNNTSCFNYRTVDGTDKLSKHALGLAIDINPFYNPYIRYTKEGGQIISPIGSEDYADRSQSFPYKIDTDDLCYRLFTQYGFTWGGNWNSSKDYQHFQKSILD